MTRGDSGIYEHMASWGVPEEYRRDYDMPAIVPARVRVVDRTANWYPEQTAALCEMVRTGDIGAIRGWDRAALVAIGDVDGDGEMYANRVMASLRVLASEVRDA